MNKKEKDLKLALVRATESVRNKFTNIQNERTETKRVLEEQYKPITKQLGKLIELNERPSADYVASDSSKFLAVKRKRLSLQQPKHSRQRKLVLTHNVTAPTFNDLAPMDVDENVSARHVNDSVDIVSDRNQFENEEYIYNEETGEKRRPRDPLLSQNKKNRIMKIKKTPKRQDWLATQNKLRKEVLFEEYRNERSIKKAAREREAQVEESLRTKKLDQEIVISRDASEGRKRLKNAKREPYKPNVSDVREMRKRANTTITASLGEPAAKLKIRTKNQINLFTPDEFSLLTENPPTRPTRTNSGSAATKKPKPKLVPMPPIAPLDDAIKNRIESLRSCNKLATKGKLPTRQGKGLPSLSANGLQHMMQEKSCADSFKYWNDANELVDRLRLLVASQSAGHTGHNNEIVSILEELQEANIIEKF
jgi:hypothetical protein